MKIKSGALSGFILALTCQYGFCEIREITSMKEIVPHIEKDTLLVFDIDNTLLEPVGNLGSDQWFYYLYKIYKINGWSDQEIETKATDVWNKAQSLVKVKSVETETPELIKTQQLRGVKTMALTSRSTDIAERTLKQLDSIHIRFDGSTLHESDVKITKSEMKSADDVLFRRGVVFVGESNNKGKALVTFLKKLGLTPKKLLYVDDKLKHVKNVDAAFAELKIPCLAFRYGALDSKVKAYNALMSEVVDRSSAQLFLFGQLD